MNIQLRAVSSLEKYLPWVNDPEGMAPPYLEGLRGEVIHWQIACRLEGADRALPVRAELSSPFGEKLSLRRVVTVPVRLAAYPDSGEGYLSDQPGLYPDLLDRADGHRLRLQPGQWQFLWLSLSTDELTPAGEHGVSLSLLDDESGEKLASLSQTLRVLSAALPEQKLVYIRWMHYDCIAQAHGMEPLGEKHWAAMESYIACALRGGINTVMVPMHTPPLDTRIGGERATVQLVSISRQGGEWRFEMSEAKRFIKMCKRLGVTWYEMPHLFTQWGAKHAPKIMAEEDGRLRRVFGWETEAAGSEYQRFLAAYIPALRRLLESEGIEDRAIWHLSDEPSAAHLPHYAALRAMLAPLLSGCLVSDALSSYDYYEKGVIERPIAATTHIKPFLEKHVEGLWAYYCCGQYRDVSNCFIAMPSGRTRILAAQLFKYRITGFLHWGFNFYHAQYADYPINPYLTTDADGWVPAGDPFIVYPGEGNAPLESLRMAVMMETMQDLRAMQLLEGLVGHDRAVEVIEKAAGRPIAFEDSRFDAAAVTAIRRAVNEAILAAK